MLERAALCSRHADAIPFYSHYAQREDKLTYGELLDVCREKACLVCKIPSIGPNSIVLLHFNTHDQSIVRFGAVLLVAYLPEISTTFTHHLTRHQKHLVHLKNLLRDPAVLTRERLPSQFEGGIKLDIHTVESLASGGSTRSSTTHYMYRRESREEHAALGVLMLAKAVALRHS